VHRYAGNPGITASGARVEIYVGSSLRTTFNVPTSGSGDWWNVADIVFDTDASTVQVNPTNQIQSTNPSPYGDVAPGPCP
jgi:hypothetical protein